MDEEDSAVELNKQLSALESNFLREFKKIAEQRLKLEQSSLSLCSTLPPVRSASENREAKSRPFPVQLNPALGVKLGRSRGKADELEDKLRQVRRAHEDKLMTADRMKQELDRRQCVLVQSLQEIETYLRAIFYLKKEADHMYEELENVAGEQNATLQKLKNDQDISRCRLKAVENAIVTFQPQEQHLENIVLDLPRYASAADLIEYYLVLLTLQGDLLEQEAACVREEDRLAAETQEVAEFKKRASAIAVSKENHLLGLKSRLKSIRGDILLLDEQVDITTMSRLKEDAHWYDIQRWIQKLFSDTTEIGPPGPEGPEADNAVNRLERIQDFVSDTLEIVDILKKKK